MSLLATAYQIGPMPVQHMNEALPNFQRVEANNMTNSLQLLDDLLGGTEEMHKKATTYIRKWADEDDGVYAVRATCEPVFGGLAVTLNAATGMIFAKPPQMTWNNSETAMTDELDNVDAGGTAFPVFAKQFAERCIRDGYAAILVDHPSAPLDPDTKQPVTVHSGNEAELGLRPSWGMYTRGSIINWRVERVNNLRKLTMIVFYEVADVPVGQYGMAQSHRFRVLQLVNGVATWKLWELANLLSGGLDNGPSTTTNATEFVFRLSGSGSYQNRVGQPLTRLPVVVAYAGRTSSNTPMVATIPLKDVADLNIAHWQASTDLRFYRKLCAFPQPTIEGDLAETISGERRIPGKIKIGPAVFVHLSKGSTFSWIELEGKSLVQLQQGVQEKLEAMSVQGLSFLNADKRYAETAQSKKLDAVAQNSTIATAAQGIENGLNEALGIHAWYHGIDPQDAPVATLSRDYEDTTMASDVMLAYVTAVATAGLPERILLQAWQAGGRIAKEEDLDKIQMEMTTARLAQEKATQLAAQTKLATAKTGTAPAKTPTAVPPGA